MTTCEALHSQDHIPRAERPIRLGSLLFTLVQPHAGYEVAYNRWYERDHLYSGCMIGEYTLAGNRYVATKACKALRFGKGRMNLSVGSYLALYWVLDGHFDQWNDWATDQVNWLHKNGRMFQKRDHIHTLLYQFAGEYNAPGSHMQIELALDRPYAGITAFLVELAPGKTVEDANAYFSGIAMPGDVTLMCSPLPLREDSPQTVPDHIGQNHVTLVAFSKDDPTMVWQDRYVPFGKGIEDAGLGTVAFASPFLAVEFGTDKYTDQL